MKSVHVELASRSYEIQVVDGATPDAFGRYARDTLSRSWAGRSCRSSLVVTDENLAGAAGAYVAALAESGLNTSLIVVPAGESAKGLDTSTSLYERLVAMRADRHTCIVAVGGGVVGDLAGFVAATYARGLPLIMVPTSLLAQVDSSVGGKVGVNLPGAKNIVGAFHQPAGVWIDLAHLATLPPRELRCGLAEVVKYGMILDLAFFEWLEAHASRIIAGDRGSTQHLIARCCELKAGVVSQDEREETGLRAVLNFGHTIGHAIEAVAGYGGDYRHGEAVAVGMVLESRLAERLGWIGPEVTGRLVDLLRRFDLPVEAPGLDLPAMLVAMSLDKKNQGGEIRFVLPRSIGRVEAARASREMILATCRSEGI